MTEHRRFEIPEGLTREEERILLASLERYFREDSPHPKPWALAGRVDATGQGALQVRRSTDSPWRGPARSPFARRGVPSLHGRGDAW